MLISTAMSTNDKLFNSPENIKYIFALISLVKDMADKSDLQYDYCKSNFNYVRANVMYCRDVLRVRLSLKVAILTYLIGMDSTSETVSPYFVTLFYRLY